MEALAISYMFFKMIGIYFGKDGWRKKIWEKITKSDDDDYREALQQLYGVLGRNLEERDAESLTWNLAMLIRMKNCYRVCCLWG